MSAFWAFSVRSVAGSGEIELVESNTVGISPPIGFSLRGTSRLSVFVVKATLNSYKVSRFSLLVGFALADWNLHYAHMGERTEVITQ